MGGGFWFWVVIHHDFSLFFFSLVPSVNFYDSELGWKAFLSVLWLLIYFSSSLMGFIHPFRFVEVVFCLVCPCCVHAYFLQDTN